jgi:hypothetical protein
MSCLLTACRLLATVTAGATPADTMRPWVAMDAWRTKPGEQVRYLRFLDANWRPARAEVAALGEVLAARVVVVPDSVANELGWDVLLVTTYRDSTAWARREETFRPVLARRGLTRIDGKGPRELASFVWEAAGRDQP